MAKLTEKQRQYFIDRVKDETNKEIKIKIDLNVGDYSGIAWGCDLTEEYVIFNSAYST